MDSPLSAAVDIVNEAFQYGVPQRMITYNFIPTLNR